MIRYTQYFIILALMLSCNGNCSDDSLFFQQDIDDQAQLSIYLKRIKLASERSHLQSPLIILEIHNNTNIGYEVDGTNMFLKSDSLTWDLQCFDSKQIIVDEHSKRFVRLVARFGYLPQDLTKLNSVFSDDHSNIKLYSKLNDSSIVLIDQAKDYSICYPD